MFKIGLSSMGGINSPELIRAYGDAGVTHLELSVGDAKEAKSIDFDSVAKWARENGVVLHSLHLPFYPNTDVEISRPEMMEATVATFNAYIEKACKFGFKYFIVHPSGEPIADADRAVRMETAKTGLRKMAELAEKCGGTVCVENLPRTCLGRSSAEMLELLGAHPALRACFDTNHLLGEDPIRFIEALGNKTVTLHVSDYDFKNERHWLPGEGAMDWQAVLAALKRVGYCGPWLYEVSLITPASITRPRSLTVADFKRNADELFSGQPLTVIGTPVSGLKRWNE